VTKMYNGDTYTRTEEDRARRIARRYGLRVEKSRQRSLHLNNLGGLQLIDPNMNAVIAGANYDCTPDAIIDHVEKLRIDAE
jgi:hypothetical protein